MNNSDNKLAKKLGMNKDGEFDNAEKYRTFLIKEEKRSPSPSKKVVFTVGILSFLISYIFWIYMGISGIPFMIIPAILVLTSFCSLICPAKKPSELTPNELRKSLKYRKKFLKWIKKRGKKK